MPARMCRPIPTTTEFAVLVAYAALALRAAPVPCRQTSDCDEGKCLVCRAKEAVERHRHLAKE